MLSMARGGSDKEDKETDLTSSVNGARLGEEEEISRGQ